MLEPVGLTPAEEAVYRLLVTLPTASADEIAEQSGLTAAKTERVLAALKTKGLASATDRTPHSFAATPPDVAPIAICPLVPGGPSGSSKEPTAALVRGSSLLEALVALFERYWEGAVPLHVSGSGMVSGTDGSPNGHELSARDRQLLSLLVAGVADKAIASQMGLSRRTVQRRIQAMMDLAGATTRMQLAWQAARRHWM
ncbi:helix-turn-helix domain-containing protein [Streptomyces sp. NPDC048496]|uniref:helix-turn-helix transcriptional regulator n=1 Tax=Streptomyces sp. NPDC048496 TaxID=3365558 RepID=UPI003712EFF6